MIQPLDEWSEWSMRVKRVCRKVQGWGSTFCRAPSYSAWLLWLFYPPSHPFFEGMAIIPHVLRCYCIQTWLMFFLGTLCIWDTLYYFMVHLCQHVMYHSTCILSLSFMFLGASLFLYYIISMGIGIPPPPHWDPVPQHWRRLSLLSSPLSLSSFSSAPLVYLFLSLSLTPLRCLVIVSLQHNSVIHFSPNTHTLGGNLLSKKNYHLALIY